MIKRPKIILLISIILVLALAIILTFQNRRSPNYTKKIVSQDTGETAYSQPNNTPETGAGQINIVLFGSYLILDNGATQDQFNLIRKSLSDYSSTKLHNQYSSLTIIPDTFVSSPGDMKAILRLGDTDKKVGIEIKIWQLSNAQVSIQDSSGKNGGDYNSGQLSVPSKTPAE